MAHIIGTANNDNLNGTAGDDLIEGVAGNDTLYGLAGNDTLDGGPGVDKMYGGAGDDSYVVDNPGDSAVDGAPIALGSIALVSRAADGTQGNFQSNDASVSADGRYVAFVSVASNLVVGESSSTGWNTSPRMAI